MQFFFNDAHVGNSQGAQIDEGPRLFRNYVDARSSFNYVGVQSYTLLWIVPAAHSCDLQCQFVNSVDSVFGGETCVRSFSMDDQLGFTYAFTRCLQQTFRTEGWFEDEYGITSLRFRF